MSSSMSNVGSVLERLSHLAAGLGMGMGQAVVASSSDKDPMFAVSSSGGWGRLLGLTAAGAGARAASGTWIWNWHEVLEFRTRLYWIVAIFVILLIAAITTPNEASFRSHLTELSFRRHLAYFRSSDDPNAHEEEIPNPDVNSHTHASEIAPVAPFRFASHVSVSLRTPPLHYRTLFFFSLALTSPLAPPIFLPDLAPSPLGRKCPWPREQVVLYVGYFGYWARAGMVPKKLEWVWRLFTDGPRDKGKRKSLLEKPGVMGMRAIAGKEETPVGNAKRDSLLTPSKLVRKSDSTANLDGLPLHAPVPAYVTESRRSSIVNLVTSSPQPDIDANSPLLIALKAELATAQTALSELQTQLSSHEESVSRAHSHLQSNLDEHRNRRKEDDAERQELKSRTKNLDEQKRQAEAARREAEKKLRAAEALRDGLESKIAAAKSEVEGLSGLMEESRKNVTNVQKEGARRVVESQGTIEDKQKELEDLEGTINQLDEGNSDLLRAVKAAEDSLAEIVKAGEEAKKLGPEEEMMMMAAAYEAAAQEGYHERPSHHPNHRDQWANQAAAYMAEAGMPMLDANYTARPSHSTSFGHLARSRQGSADHNVDTHSQSQAQSQPIGVPNTFGNYRMDKERPSTPPQSSDSGSDVWGHDPGSPNGGISSTFSSNLLPQGLFRSLEGDQTPLGASTNDHDDESPTARRVPSKSPLLGSPKTHLNGSRFIEQHDDSSDSSSEHDLWRSPIPAPSTIGPTDGQGRLLPPSSTPPSGPALPGLPSLPSARRWFSGTNSAENLNLGPFGPSASNDSLLHRTVSPYETNAFAPSASEKKALALNWGSLSRRWRPENGEGAASPTTSRNLSLNTNWLSSSRSKLSNSTSATSHMLRNSISQDILRSSSSSTTANNNGQPDVERDGEEKNEEEGGDSVGSVGESPKRPFRFFSLRRPNSSGQGSNSSTGQLSTSQSSTLS